MDAIDRAILAHLHDDGRLANAELAERIRLSPSATLRRVRNLERTKAITGYHAEIDPKAVGRGFEITVHATLIMRNRVSIETFEADFVEIE
jgi:DNA-binding Lrp family transcriptional regulator